MTTSQISFLSEIVGGKQISIGKLAYFRARLTNKLHELVLTEFVRQAREGKISKAKLARRTRRKPEQITRWLGAPGNWTIETVSDLLLGMGYEPSVSLIALADTKASVIPMREDGESITTRTDNSSDNSVFAFPEPINKESLLRGTIKRTGNG